jgi:hypothetical protein
MGTSASSNGPGSGISLDPAWLDDIDYNGADSFGEGQIDENSSDVSQDTLNTLNVAPRGRFSSARRNMREYVRSGSSDSLRRSLGHYSRTGMGGAKALSHRMRASAKVGSNFYGAFRSLRDDPEFALGKVLSDLKAQGANAHQIISTIVEHVCPNGGSIDEVSLRNSATAALSEYLEEHPTVDFCRLSDDQMWELTGTYVGNEIFERVQMDIGQAFEKTDITVSERIVRMNSMKAFIQAEVAVQLNKIRETESKTVNVEKLIQCTIQATFEVYEEAV